MNKHILVLFLTIGISLMAAANTYANSQVTLLKPFTVTADESHERAIQATIPNRTTVAVAFSGKDKAIKVAENSHNVHTSIENNGRTVIISASFSEDDQGTVTPVHIMTKDGRTHTIVLIPLGKRYDKNAALIKVVIKSNTH